MTSLCDFVHRSGYAQDILGVTEIQACSGLDWVNMPTNDHAEDHGRRRVFPTSLHLDLL